jgi:Leucine-rich repeat (LRR) protein
MVRRRRGLSTTRKRRKKREGSLGNYVTTREEPYATRSFLGGDNSSFPAASTVESSPLSLSSTSSSSTDFRQVPSPSAEYLRSSSSSSLPYLSSTTKVTFLPSLEYVNLNNNRLKKIPFEAIQNLSTGATNSLKVLDLRSNVITATSDMIDYKGKKLSLESLYLDFNR